MKLNVAAYPPYSDATIDRTWSQEVMEAILNERKQLYAVTSGIATKAEDDAANSDINLAATAELGSGTYRFMPAATAQYETGVAALEWERDGVTVLAFRGSYTRGDFGNIENWCAVVRLK